MAQGCGYTTSSTVHPPRHHYRETSILGRPFVHYTGLLAPLSLRPSAWGADAHKGNLEQVNHVIHVCLTFCRRAFAPISYAYNSSSRVATTSILSCQRMIDVTGKMKVEKNVQASRYRADSSAPSCTGHRVLPQSSADCKIDRTTRVNSIGNMS